MRDFSRRMRIFDRILFGTSGNVGLIFVAATPVNVGVLEGVDLYRRFQKLASPHIKMAFNESHGLEIAFSLGHVGGAHVCLCSSC